MKKHFLVIFSVIFLLLVFSFVSGCNKNEQSLAKTSVEEIKEVNSNVSESSESPKGEEISSSDSNQESVTSEDETTEVIPVATVPENWPDAIPINPDIVITISNVGDTEGKYVASVDGTYSGEADDIYNYYKQVFSNLDIDEYVQEWDNGSVKNTIQTSKDGYDIAVSVTKSDRGVDVSLWVKKQ